MKKLSMYLIFLISSTDLLSIEYYSKVDESLPEIGNQSTVYLGDQMFLQRSGYYMQCLIPKESFQASFYHNERECLISNTRIEKKCCLGGVRQITEGGQMCKKKRDIYSPPSNEFYPDNFYSYVKNNEKSKTNFFSISSPYGKTGKQKVTIYQEPAQAKMITMSLDEFNLKFTKTSKVDAKIIFFDKDKKYCLSEDKKTLVTDGKKHNFATRGSISVDADLSQVTPNKETFMFINNFDSGDSFELDDSPYEEGLAIVNKDRFNADKKYVTSNDALQQSIEYAGKNGNILKFLYSEFYSLRARDAFNREFQVDLAEGNVGAFKGAVFEIIDADNVNITYKVIRGFSK